MMDDFALTISEHKHVARGVPEVRAVLTVTAGDDAAAAGPDAPGLAEVIVVDTSGSMMIGAKMADARRATIAAIEALPAGAAFAVIAGDNGARLVYPTEQRLAVAGERTVRAARAAVRQLSASGGTAIGAWLGLARTLLAGRTGDVRHVTLLTDGKNAERGDVLARALTECRDVFQCDARGIGADWNARELIGIAEALRGQARAVTATTDLAADFRSIVATWTAKALREVTLRIELSPFAELAHLRQVHPVKTDLGGHTRPAGPRTLDVSTGAWAPGELREYHLCVRVGSAGELNEDLRAGRIDLIADGIRRAAPALVLLHRISDDHAAQPLDPREGDYQRQYELSRAIGDGCGAYLQSEQDRAEADFGRAVALAHADGDDYMLSLLQRVVRIDDAAAGRVRLRPDLRVEDLLLLETDSQTSRASRQDPVVAPVSPAAGVVCACGEPVGAGAKFCGECGRRR